MQASRDNARRQTRREDCRILGTVRHMSQSARARVVDISERGMNLVLADAFRVPFGTLVTIATAELGQIEGQVCWQEGRRLGIRLRQNSNAQAQVSSYFRFYHQAPATLARH